MSRAYEGPTASARVWPLQKHTSCICFGKSQKVWFSNVPIAERPRSTGTSTLAPPIEGRHP